MLTNIFGFPNSMSLQKFEGSYRFSRISDQEGLYSCTICNKPNILIDEFYFHVKTHLNEQHESDMNSLAQKSNTSPCCICNQVVFDATRTTKDLEVSVDTEWLIKAHHDNHLKQLKDYMRETVNTLRKE